MISILKASIWALFIFLLSFSHSYAKELFADEMCAIVAISTGTLGKVILSISVIMTGVGFFSGKIKWGTLIATVAGIALFAGSGSIVSALSNNDEYDCTLHNLDRNNLYSSCIEVAEFETIEMVVPNGNVWTDIKFAEYGTVSNCQIINTISCKDGDPGVTNSSNVRNLISNECLGKKKCSFVVRNFRFGGNPCRGTARGVKRLGVIMIYK